MTRPELPSGTVTLLFTDIEGSTRLLHRLGPEGYGEALAEHRRLLRSAFSAEGGVEVDTQGDAFFVAFPRATGAAAAARSAHLLLESGPITVRMGLHTGTPTVTTEGYVGIDVHRGARIGAIAHGGQVIVSDATAALLGDEELLDLGRHRLRDFDAPAQLFQLGVEKFPPLRTPGAVDLPVPPTQFLGRAGELFDAASVWLDRDPRVMTVVGPGGAGKTRFSIELARFVADDAAGGTVFVALAAVRNAAMVVPMIADRLGATGVDAEAIAMRIGVKRTHVVLDNLEQLLPAAARPLADLLAAAPALPIVATSRQPLRIAGETEFDLPPMDETDAVALFVERARAISPDMADSPAVRELIRRLDGLPLAIELAAARVKLLGPEQILERIGQRLDLLKGGHDADERHVTLRATIAWSHDLLDDDEQQLFARLAVFRGGWTIGAAEAICECDLDTLGSLLDKSLIRQRTVENGDKWFWMLETIREYAAERLAASGKEDALRRLQTDWLIELANRAGTRGTIGIPGTWEVDLIAPEIDNVRATLEWATHTEPERGLVLAAYLEGYWLIRDAAEGVRWLEPLLAANPDADLELRGHALRALAGAHSVVGDAPRALARCQESLEHFIACGNEIQIASLRYHLATTMISTDEEAAAWPILEELLETFRELKLPRGEAQVLGYLGDRPSHEGDYARALELTLESARIAREDDWPWWAAGQLGGACWLEMLRENFEAAEAHGRAAVELDLRLGNHHRVTRAAGMLAVIAAERGQVERAGRLWGAIESEQIIRPVPGWEARLAEHGARVLRLDGPEFAIARAEGRLMSIAQAAEQPE